MFSATFEGYVAKLAANLLNQPLRIDVASHRQPLTNIAQRLHWADNFRHKNELLDHLLRDADINQALVFTSTQRDTETIALRLEEQGHAVAVLHGGMPQGKRNRMLRSLREGQVRVLVATDVAARGIDVPAISHVINYGLPMNAEDYVHRIGRTGRAGRTGIAVTLAEARDQGMIRRIEKFTANPIPVQTVVGLEPKLAGQKSPSAKPTGRGRSSFGAARPGTSKPGSRPAKKTWGQSREGQRAAPAPKSGQGFAKKSAAHYK
jgi:superfamily II DNA/RNA helicase